MLVIVEQEQATQLWRARPAESVLTFEASKIEGLTAKDVSGPASRVTTKSQSVVAAQAPVIGARTIAKAHHLARPPHLQHSSNWIYSIVDAFNERQAVAAYLDGKTLVFTGEVAFEAWGLRYEQMDRVAWGRIASAIKSAGWTKSHVDRHPCWIRSEASPAPSPVQQESLPL